MSKIIVMPQTIMMYTQMGATPESINAMVAQGTVRSYYNKDKEEVQYLSIDDDDPVDEQTNKPTNI